MMKQDEMPLAESKDGEKSVWCTDFNEDKHLGNTEGKSKIQMEDGGV